MSWDWFSRNANGIDEYAGGYLTRAGRPMMAGAAFVYICVLALAAGLAACFGYLRKVTSRRPPA
jgi:hypothetical protein